MVCPLLSLLRNSVDRSTDRLDMTLVADWAVQPQYKQKTKNLIRLGRCSGWSDS